MKKILFAATIFLPVMVFGCVCTGDIETSFDRAAHYVADKNVRPMHNNITNRLIPAIQKNTDTIKKQNEQLKKLIEEEKYKSLQYRKIIFELERKRSLLGNDR